MADRSSPSGPPCNVSAEPFAPLFPVLTTQATAPDADSKPTRAKPPLLSPARLRTGDHGKKTVKPASKRAKQVKVASTGGGPTGMSTNTVEVWLPLQGAGGDARILVKLQGAAPDFCSMEYLSTTPNKFTRKTDCQSSSSGVCPLPQPPPPPPLLLLLLQMALSGTSHDTDKRCRSFVCGAGDRERLSIPVRLRASSSVL
jgi:hypothetical protein